MLTLRGHQLFIIFVIIGVSMVLAADDEHKGPFGTSTQYAEGACLSPEPTGFVDEKLTNYLETKGFSVAMCSQSYAAIILRIWDEGNTGGINGSNQFYGKYDANRQDLSLHMTTEGSSDVKMRCEIVSSTKKKCYKLPEKDYISTMTTVWTNEKFLLLVGCTSDGYKFWAVLTTLPTTPYVYHVKMEEDEKNMIFEQVEKLGFKRSMVYQGYE